MPATHVSKASSAPVDLLWSDLQGFPLLDGVKTRHCGTIRTGETVSARRRALSSFLN